MLPLCYAATQFFGVLFADSSFETRRQQVQRPSQRRAQHRQRRTESFDPKRHRIAERASNPALRPDQLEPVSGRRQVRGFGLGRHRDVGVVQQLAAVVDESPVEVDDGADREPRRNIADVERRRLCPTGPEKVGHRKSADVAVRDAVTGSVDADGTTRAAVRQTGDCRQRRRDSAEPQPVGDEAGEAGGVDRQLDGKVSDASG